MGNPSQPENAGAVCENPIWDDGVDLAVLKMPKDIYARIVEHNPRLAFAVSHLLLENESPPIFFDVNHVQMTIKVDVDASLAWLNYRSTALAAELLDDAGRQRPSPINFLGEDVSPEHWPQDEGYRLWRFQSDEPDDGVGTGLTLRLVDTGQRNSIAEAPEMAIVIYDVVDVSLE